MVGAWHGQGTASVNQTQQHCVNQMGKTHSKPLAAQYGRGMSWVQHGHGTLCVNRPLGIKTLQSHVSPLALPSYAYEQEL